MDLTAARCQMPVANRWIYLDHAAVAPLSAPAAAAMRATVYQVEHDGFAHPDRWTQSITQARHSAAAMLNADAQSIAFFHNTTEGILAAANGIDWAPGDNVVLPSCEFPANVYPWVNLAHKGVQVHWVQPREHRLCVDDFRAAVTARTRAMAVSSVEFFSGFRNDLAGLSDICRQHDILLIVDAIQSLGALRMDVTSLGIDVLAADAHKWLMGPEGCAVLHCSARALERLGVASLGWAGVASAFDFLSYDTELQPDARRFETGTHNMAGIAGLRAAMDFLYGQGPAEVETRVLALTDALCDALRTLGCTVVSPRGENEKSGIVTFTHPRAYADTVLQRLRAERVLGTARGGTVRLSPHFYNTTDELRCAAEALATL